MTSTVDDENKVQGIVFLADEASKFLNPREEIAGRVAENSGDCRKALSILLNTGRRADQEGHNKVRLKDIQ